VAGWRAFAGAGLVTPKFERKLNMNTSLKGLRSSPVRSVALFAALAGGQTAYAQIPSLKEVTVTGSANPYAVETTSAGTRTATPLEEVPQSVVVIPRKVADDQGAQTLSDVLRNVSGVTAIDQRDSNLAGFKVRGFGAATVVDGVPTPGIFQNQEGLVGVDRVSVIKGPSGGLFGGSQGMNYSTAGGVVVIDTAQAESVSSRQGAVSVGGLGHHAASFDLNQAISPTLAARVTGEYAKVDSETDGVFHKRRSVLSSVVLTPNAQTKLVLRLRDLRNETLDYPGLPRAQADSPDVISGVGRSKFIGATGLPPTTNEMTGVNLQWSKTLSAQWDFGLTVANNKMTLLQNGAFNGAVIDSFLGTAQFGNPVQDIYGYQLSQRFDSTVVSPSFTGKLSLGGSQHLVRAGIDHEVSREDAYLYFSNPANATFFGAPYISALATNVDLRGPASAVWVTPAGNSGFDSAYGRKFNATTTYLQDQVKWGAWSVLGSVRMNRLEMQDTSAGQTRTRTADSVTPRIGLVYALSDRLSTFAGYSRAVQTPYLTTYAPSVTPEPEDVKQAEIGFRLKDFAGLSASFALFDLRRNNVATAAGFSNYLTNQGTQGLDIDVRYSVNPSWQWMAAYANQNPRTTGTAYAQVASYVGKQLFNVPKEQLRLATRYDAQAGPWAGFGVGVGVTYQSPLAGDSNNSFFTPSSTVWDAQVSYQRKSVRYGVQIANLWDSKHFVPSNYFGGGQVLPAAPRTVVASAVVNF
jgi:iron complex outermembrane receptor protein